MTPLAFIDYPTLRQYARTCCRQKRVRECDVEDITHDAWIDCQRRARSAVARGNPEALARKIMFTSIQDAIKSLKARTASEVPLADALAKRPTAFSDSGDAADRAFLAADNWQTPFWLRLFIIVRKELERDARNGDVSRNVPKAVNLLLADSRLPIVRERLKVSRPSFGTILGILKVRFALCFRAYEAFLAFRRGLHF